MQLAPIPGNKMICFLGCIELACIVFSSITGIELFISPFSCGFVGNLYVCPPLMGTRIPSYHFRWYLEAPSPIVSDAPRNDNIFTSIGMVLGTTLKSHLFYHGYILRQWGWYYKKHFTSIPVLCLHSKFETNKVDFDGWHRSDRFYTVCSDIFIIISYGKRVISVSESSQLLSQHVCFIIMVFYTVLITYSWSAFGCCSTGLH